MNSDTARWQTDDIFIGMGSNLNQPQKQLCQALSNLQLLTGVTLSRCSSVYVSEPMGGLDQSDYLNAVVKISSNLSPWGLLRALQRIENAQGRTRSSHWGSRTLDLDILLLGSRQQSDPILHLPHPGIYMRRFALEPLIEIEPKLRFPDGSSIEQRLRECPASRIHKIDVNEFKLP